MKKYRKRPLVIEAAQWDGLKLGGYYAGKILEEDSWHYGHAPGDGNLYELVIKTLEGDMVCGVGDWIIKGIKGEFYPCKADIFKATYEEEQPTPQDASCS